MQRLDVSVLEQVKGLRMKKLEKQLSYLKQETPNTLITCPFCKYIGKNKRGTAKIFYNKTGNTFKCFCCGVWRKI